jgi:RNase P subunit RPR2
MLPRLALDDVEVFLAPNGATAVRARCYIPAGTEVAYASHNNETRHIRHVSVNGLSFAAATLVSVRQKNGTFLLCATRDIQDGEELVLRDPVPVVLATKTARKTVPQAAPRRFCTECKKSLPETAEHFRLMRSSKSEKTYMRYVCKPCELAHDRERMREKKRERK